MFTDVAGYTALMESDEETARLLRDRHRTVLGGAVVESGGELLEHYGDGSLSIFGSAIEAVACALEIQRTLADDPVVPLRIGIHTGDIVREDQGVYGDGVNVASRVQGLCPPGEVRISGKVADDV
jgi:class 3 adenylate cyclase